MYIENFYKDILCSAEEWAMLDPPLEVLIMNKKLFFLSMTLSLSVYAKSVERISFTMSQGLDPVLAEADLKGAFLVTAKKNVSEGHSRIGKTELTLLGFVKDPEFPVYTIAAKSKVVLVSMPGPRDEPIPSKLSGVLPNGKGFEVTLQRQIITEEVKPEAAMIKTYCGKNELNGILEEANVVEVCIEGADNTKDVN